MLCAISKSFPGDDTTMQQNTTAGGSAELPQAAPESGQHPPPGLNLELLVHGVGGTTPQEMLGDPRVERVTGDTTAAVYRRTEDVDAESRPGDYTDKPIPEAYSWSNLTSGNGSRALWLILLPFMVVNLAHWSRPAADRRHRAVRAHGVLVRLIALSLTVLLVSAACEVALDLVAWQCAGSAACASHHSWLGFMAQSRAGHGGWWGQPGRRLALAATMPTALTVLLWWLSHRTWTAYESQRPLERPLSGYDTQAARRPALCLPGFWYGKRLVSRLRAAHTGAGFLTVAGALATTTLRQDGASAASGGAMALRVLGWGLMALIALCSLWVIYVVCRRGRKESEPDHALDSVSVRALPAVSLGITLLAAVHAAWSRPGWSSAGEQLPGDAAFGVIVVAQGVLIVALAVLGVVLYRARPVARTAVKGLAAAGVAMLACALAGVMTGGVAQRVGDWLDGSGAPGGGQGIKGPPIVLSWQSSTIPVILGVVLVLLLWFLARISRESKALVPEVERGFPNALPDPARSRRIASVIARASVTDSATWIVGVIALSALLLGCVAVLGTALTGKPPGAAANGTPAVLDGFADSVQKLGSWLLGLAFVLFVTWGVRAYRDPSARRTIGILWDVGTFWPRAAHPFAPPCYAERAVPDLAWRMATWTEQTGGRLVISGHSQGSVLAAAAVWHLDPVTRRQVALLTYGCPLERLYGRWFPAYFGPRQLDDLHHELDCWRNLWRLTDPIGGPIRLPGERVEDPGSGVDRGPLLDPLLYGRTISHPLPAPILGHGDYQADPAFDEERDRLLTRLRWREPSIGCAEDRPEPPTGAAAAQKGVEGLPRQSVQGSRPQTRLQGDGRTRGAATTQGDARVPSEDGG
jgi:hypothetical protein